jgi:hypothetical protein
MEKRFLPAAAQSAPYLQVESRDRSRKGDYAPPHQGGECLLKFLIDECLSLDVVAVAQGHGFVESSHVVWMVKAGWKDWELKPFILEGDWTLVTRNSVDFRVPRTIQ